MTLEDQSPSVHQMALGLSIILFHTMVENECDGTKIISLSDAFTALIDLDRTDLAMSLMIGLLGEYGMGMPSEFIMAGACSRRKSRALSAPPRSAWRKRAFTTSTAMVRSPQPTKI